MSIGPQLPPHLQRNVTVDEDSDEDDCYGPSLPPHLVKARVNASRPVSYASQPGQKPANQVLHSIVSDSFLFFCH